MKEEDEDPLKGLDKSTINLAKKAYADFLKQEKLEAKKEEEKEKKMAGKVIKNNLGTIDEEVLELSDEDDYAL